MKTSTNEERPATLCCSENVCCPHLKPGVHSTLWDHLTVASLMPPLHSWRDQTMHSPTGRLHMLEIWRVWEIKEEVWNQIQHGALKTVIFWMLNDALTTASSQSSSLSSIINLTVLTQFSHLWDTFNSEKQAIDIATSKQANKIFVRVLGLQILCHGLVNQPEFASSSDPVFDIGHLLAVWLLQQHNSLLQVKAFTLKA